MLQAASRIWPITQNERCDRRFSVVFDGWWISFCFFLSLHSLLNLRNESNLLDKVDEVHEAADRGVPCCVLYADDFDHFGYILHHGSEQTFLTT